METIDLFDRVAKLFLEAIKDDYTNTGFLGVIEDEIPELRNKPRASKLLMLEVIAKLLEEKKIRVGLLNDDDGSGPFLNYWEMTDEEIIKKLDKEWDSYFSQGAVPYVTTPTFDLTESYAREIGKYPSDVEKIKKERPKSS